MNISIFKKFKLISLTLISVYILCVVAKNFLNIQFISTTWIGIVVLVLLTISVLHGMLWYSKKTILFLIFITFVISWSLESLSIKTGFPFGHYHYTNKLLKPNGIPLYLGNVPIIIMFAYFAVGYLSWTLSHVICLRMTKNYSRKDTVLIPGIAAFFMTAWGLTFVPLSSTQMDLWIWENGGAYFGVPTHNFIGWYCCVFSIFLLFFLYIKNKQHPSCYKFSKKFWFYPLLTYTVIPIDSITRPLRAILEYDKNEIISTPKYKIGGEITRWHTYDIYFTLALVSVFTMFMTGIFLLVFLYRQPFNKTDD